ncbi:NAD(P)-dependent dehydrogenase (short-subunit alcohol dehydrogenase family) [Algoriphagus iocasae]|uniref:NAD(P)-dependent dehydrogenase (Short-subunit alcohol dehydrogenase family) n=1 Tax=Algoriphagus iocasae TaxID=1836499 RepID=A0A841MJF4_9BACT|nr:SDR family oxidoreductase [Algoriphagus iocasae]MBB6324994.1 NAD(P)-dependent dehydrogenase (short-subunit alcohol dehydrogenase family) [Algoriphagus iocasae]
MNDSKIALVTGGSRGLGRDIALRLAEKGNDLIITYHTNEKAANEVVAEIEKLGQTAKAFSLDTRDIKGFEAFFTMLYEYLQSKKQRETFDYLINNAGTGLYVPFLETTEAMFDEMANIHLKGVYFLTQKAVPFLSEGGGIINISSGLARFSLPSSSAYGAMKGGVDVLTRYLAKELAGKKIRANVVAPGAIATKFGGGENRDNEQKRKLISGATALGRVGEAEDIGGVVAFLCSEDARWINGQRIEVSGGIFL